MNRRVFLKVLGASATLAAWEGELSLATDIDLQYEEIDAGPIDAFAEDNVYDQFREQGFLLIRRADEIFSLSSICTHKGCKVRAQEDQSYLCKCHKSRFDSAGKVLNGPATVDLPRLKVKLSDQRHILVRLPART